MAIASPAPAGSSAAAASADPGVWRAPLVPAALVLTTGIVLDRYVAIPVTFSLGAAIIFLIAWAAARAGRSQGLSLAYLAGAVAAFGAAYHHSHGSIYPVDDVGGLAGPDSQPACIRGTLDEEPIVTWQPPNDGLQSFDRPDPTVSVLRVTERKEDDRWLPASGRLRLVVGGPLHDLHVGDEVEAVGRLVAPPTPSNPGEFDYPERLKDQRIRALFLVRKTGDAVHRREEGSLWSPAAWLAAGRARCQRAIQQALPADQSGVATALLLGEGSTMTTADWQKYVRTGVIHVLAVSGQHLVVLAGFLWFGLRLFGVRPRRGAWFVALALFAYALLAGGRPPVLRSAIMVAVFCGGTILRRPALTANAFALAWIVVAAVNPADLFDAGCQLSFLAVAVLYWGTRWLRAAPDALEQLVDESRPPWQRALRRLGRVVIGSYAITTLIWLAAAPLVAAHYHLVSPIALLIGPPMVVLASVALIAGFLLLLAALVCWPLVPVFAAVTGVSLWACEGLVGAADRWRAYFYVGDVPEWWLWGIYAGLFAVLWLPSLRQRWWWMATAAAAWLCVGLAAGAVRPQAAGVLRCTFLAVGHGGCTVIETPDGRTLLYDAGALGGPDVTRRQIAPFLWQRGIRRIDEVFLSHADLDHFNGLPALVERFSVGQVTCTATFSRKGTAGVAAALESLRRSGIEMRMVGAGDRLAAGAVTIDVLHPPPEAFGQTENERSLVLLIRHEDHSILLTGDLEKTGMDRVLALPSPRPDVLMAPHHGSKTANSPGLAEWARPRLVVACQGPPHGRVASPYGATVPFLGTWPHGAVTVRSSAAGLTVETFSSKLRFDFETRK